VLGTIIYENNKIDLYKDKDDLLLSKSQDVSSSINAYWQFKFQDVLRPKDPSIAYRKNHNLHFIDAVDELIESQSDDLDYFNTIVQVFDDRGNLIAGSQYLKNPEPIDETSIKKLVQGKKVFAQMSFITISQKLVDFRVLTYPVIENKKLVYIVQTAQSLEWVLKSLRRLQISLLIFIPLTAFLAAISTSLFLANLILKPLKLLTHTARKISATNLEERTIVPKSNDEISDLSRTFNAMIDEIQKGVETQKKFLTDCSHELRTPLTIMRGDIEVLLTRKRDTSEYISIMESNLIEIQRLQRLVEELLVLSRIESAESKHEFILTDLNAIMDTLKEDWELFAKSKNVKLIFYPPTDGVLVKILKDKIQRAIINLLDNALKFTPEHGEIKISWGIENNNAIIKIEDTGIGVLKENLSKLSERFYREGRSDQSGLGLGLSIVRSIINIHKGTMDLFSEENHGFMVQLSLPVEH